MLKDLTAPPSPVPSSRRFRPPKIDLTRAIEKESPTVYVESDSSTVDDDVFEETLQLSDSDSSEPPSPRVKIASADDEPLPDDITKDLAVLQELRQSVKKNLLLRPIRSRGNLPKVDISAGLPRSPFTARTSPRPTSAVTLSPASSVASSYFTPVSEFPSSALFSATNPPLSAPLPPVAHTACAISPKSLYDRLLAPKRPLLIDTRPLAAHQSFHLCHSINIAIPSLILKRCRRPGGGLQSLDALRSYTTTEQGKALWDDLMRPGGPWDGNVVVCDDEMNPKDKDNLGITAWAIIPVIYPLLSHGSIDYLQDGISSVSYHPELGTLIRTGEEAETPPTPQTAPAFQSGFQVARKGSGLFQLDTQIRDEQREERAQAHQRIR